MSDEYDDAGEYVQPRNDGGPAFPQDHYTSPTGLSFMGGAGMTLRDYFAAKALPSVIQDWLNSGDIFQDPEITECIARDAYIVADAMLEARK